MASRLVRTVTDLSGIYSCVSVPLRRYDGSILGTVGEANSCSRLGTLVRGVETGVPNLSLHAALVINFPNRASRRFRRLYGFIGRVGFSGVNYFGFSPRRNAPTCSVPGRIRRSIGSEHRRILNSVRCAMARGTGGDQVNGVCGAVISSRRNSGCVNEDCLSSPRVSDNVVFASPHRLRTNSFIGIGVASCSKCSLVKRLTR